MKKTAIAISGLANQGKSVTVKMIATELERQFPQLQKQVINDGTDITYVLQINNLKIGIESQGDPYSRLMNSLSIFVQNDCDIIVCSSRTSGMTTKAVNNLHNQYGYDIIWATNYRSLQKNQTQLNQISANKMVKLIKFIMK